MSEGRVLGPSGGLGGWSAVCVGEGEGEGANGLPLAAASAQVLARFRALGPLLAHPRLSRSLELQRGANQRVFVLEERPGPCLAEALRGAPLPLGRLRRVAAELCEALGFLHSLHWRHGSAVVHRHLGLPNVFLLPCGGVRLGQAAAYAASDSGRLVHTAIGSGLLLPPEAFLAPATPSGPKADSWALGLLLFQLARHIDLTALWTPRQIHGIYTSLIDKAQGGSILRGLSAAVASASPQAAEVDLLKEDEALARFAESLLIVDLRERSLPVAPEGFEQPETTGTEQDSLSLHECFQPFREAARVGVQEYKAAKAKGGEASLTWQSELLVEEVAALWKLAGPSLESIFLRSGMVESKPPITTLPLLISSGRLVGRAEQRRQASELSFVPLSMELLGSRLEGLGPGSLLPSPVAPPPEDPGLPIPVKERDIGYQLERLVQLRRLLRGLPVTRAEVVEEAGKDVPPHYRPFVWAALVEASPALVRQAAEDLDVLALTPTDRQIDVDAPRCHQYDALMSSPEAQDSLKRLLKAWLHANPHYVYWQGLDSLATPFLQLHYHRPRLAFACLSAFIPRYLHDFFKYDNSAIIQEYLAVFSQLVGFHDAELAAHLQSVDFFPELFAIPWFLTMFAHVFPLEKLYHLWDALLVGDSGFPLCVGVGILRQLRPQLLSQGFNESILLFSDLPEIDIARCVRDSKALYAQTPKSVVFRAHGPPGERAGMGEGLGRREALPLAQLKAEPSPRISIADVVGLGDGALVVDTRPFDEFLRGSWTGAVSVPQREEEEAEAEESLAWQRLRAARGAKVLVLLDRSPERSAAFAQRLRRQRFPRVALLDGQLSALRAANLISLPPAQ